MANDVLKMRYTNGLFLKQEEFNVEQNYHIRMRRLHNRHLHTWGISAGLEVVAGPGSKEITVKEGMALNKTMIDGEATSQEIIVPRDTPVDLSNFAAGDWVYVWLAYSDVKTDIVVDKGGQEEIHWLEKAEIKAEKTPPADRSENILLAKAVLKPDGTIDVNSIKYAEDNGTALRTYAGVAGKSLETQKLTLGIEGQTSNLAFVEGKVINGLNGINVNSAESNFTGNVTIQGNIAVLGEGGKFEVKEAVIEDNIVTVNKYPPQNTPLSINGGLEVFRGGGAGYPNAQIIWDEAVDRWKFGTVGNLQDVAYGLNAVKLLDNSSAEGLHKHSSMFTANGTLALSVDAAGKVGIGIAAPLTALHIPANGLQIGTSATVLDNFHWVSDTTGGSRGYRLFGGNYGSGTHMLTVLPNGNVGIGATTPGSTLDVGGTSNSAFIQNLSAWGLNARVQGILIMPEGNVTDDGAGNLTIPSTIIMNPLSGSWIRVAAGTYTLGGWQSLWAPIPPTGARGTTVTPTVLAWSDTDRNYDGRDRVLLAQRQSAGPIYTRFGVQANYTGNAGACFLGNVGIGTTSPSNRLEVAGNVVLKSPDSNIYSLQFVRNDENSRIHKWALWHMNNSYRKNAFEIWEYKTDSTGKDCGGNTADGAMCTPRLTILEGGNVGIGITSPNDVLDVGGTLRILTGSNPIRFTSTWSGFPDATTNQAEISNDTGTYKTLMIIGNKSAGLGRRVSVWDRLEVNGHHKVTGIIGTNGYEPNQGLPSGWGGGVHTWDIAAHGTGRAVSGWQTGGWDLAEKYENFDTSLEPGDVVVADLNSAERLIKSSSPYQDNILGIISEKPGFLLGVSWEDPTYPIALGLAGRVPVKVNLEGGPIKIGDYLTSSNEAGYAMKANQSGRVLGFALEEFDGNKGQKGKVVIFINPHWLEQ